MAAFLSTFLAYSCLVVRADQQQHVQLTVDCLQVHHDNPKDSHTVRNQKQREVVVKLEEEVAIAQHPD